MARKVRTTNRPAPVERNDEQLTTLIAALTEAFGPAAAAATEQAVTEAAEDRSAKEQIDAAIAEAGFVPVRGRVYGDGSLLEAGARVLKTGRTEIVRLAGDHRTKAVCVFRTESGSVAFQNLGVAE
jgi:hypothetical protein